ncbi:DUF427 domain-containing protein [Algiphilus sp.]|uniref:DUF427 domain-containing protein n=1 Tax=Algiphilus sp. TaxID=1872431 RepID=UPI003B519744
MSNDEARRYGWVYDGSQRPPFAETPGPGQESIWDYPRPPALVADSRRVRVFLGEQLVAETRQAYRLLETAGAPTFYLPPEAVDLSLLHPAPARSHCEWKGQAQYWDVRSGSQQADHAAWAYPKPHARYAAIAGYIAFYLGDLLGYVDDEQARPQPGGFYGGWVTRDVVGPFKGEAGTQGW